MNRLGHGHFIRGIAYYTQAENHFLLFPWTEEGNLEQLWAKTDSTLPSTHCWAFKQLKGLASGIRMLHAENCRHGDLKPPNILCFRRNGETLDEMRLVIADVGLAKVHNEITQHRGHATKTTAISVTYMPPEFDLDARRDEPASRLYDIWSIGCVFLEFAIWLAHGLGGLQDFRTAVRGGGPSKPPVPFWNDNPSDNPSDDLRPVVKQTIKYLLDDHKPGSPLHRLVRLIKDRLLVVNVPDRNTRTQRALRQPADASEARSSASNTAPRVELTTATWNEDVRPINKPARADAEEFDDIMTDILRDVKVGSYRLELTTSTSTARSLATSMAHLSVEDARRNSLGSQTARNRNPMFNNTWEYTPDEGLARQIFQTIDVHTVLPPHESTSLCTRCNGLDLLSPNCEFSDTVFSLESRIGVSNCTLCRLLLTWCNGRDEAAGMTFGFFRAEARIAPRGDEKRGVATLCRADKGYPPRGIQLGFPRLPEAGSKAHMSVISHWLTQCDEVHNCYPRNMSFFPTRLIDVVGDSSPSVRLVCDTSHIDQGTKYIALSHMWGPNHQKTLKTLEANVQGRKEWVIPLDHLPKTFLDAIKVTRSLGHRFLWIDSLCIIQDDREDWHRESQRMEEVFSSAYCVIAATCASGTDDGFLKPRSERQAIPMTDAKSGISYYVCEAINDFSGHVDGSDINSRGWVLQERALARRTIHFTESQTYWECGSGVRCETLTRMNNDKASFLGDSNFPAYAVSQFKGKKIKLLQDLYEQYSNKKLSFAKDRPVAIKGLETRLIQTVGGQGGYGVFQNHLHRYLLWHRGKQPLEGIEEFSGGPVPTWSWMAWKGGIEFMRDIPGGTVDWNPKVGWLSPPTGANRDDPESLFLGAPVFDFTSSYINGLLLDNGEEHLPPGAKCVVLGVTQNQLVCYVLVVIRSTAPSAGSMGTWKRIGVGRVAQRHVVTEEPGSPVTFTKIGAHDCWTI
ncbi:HET domain containing protein [Rhypophila decipiens]